MASYSAARENFHVEVRQIADGIAGTGAQIFDHLSVQVHTQAVALADLSCFPQGQWGQAKVEADAEKGPGKSRRDERPDAAVLERYSSLNCPFSISHASGREEQDARSPERAVRDPRHDFLTRQRAFYDPRLTGQNDFVEFHALSPEVSRSSE